jgi:hypothetical protein
LLTIPQGRLGAAILLTDQGDGSQRISRQGSAVAAIKGIPISGLVEFTDSGAYGGVVR